MNHIKNTGVCSFFYTNWEEGVWVLNLGKSYYVLYGRPWKNSKNAFEISSSGLNPRFLTVTLKDFSRASNPK
jgi:hypothetical protein